MCIRDSFKLRAQKLAAKIARDLHHAFGRFRRYGIDFLLVNDAVLHAMEQCLLKKRSRIKQ